MARPSLVNTCFRLPTERVFTAAAPTSSAKHQIASMRSEEHTSELQSRLHLVCRLLLEKKKNSHSDRDPALAFAPPRRGVRVAYRARLEIAWAGSTDL